MWYSICADNLKQRLECTLPDNQHCFTYKRIKFPVCYRKFFNLLFKTSGILSNEVKRGILCLGKPSIPGNWRHRKTQSIRSMIIIQSHLSNRSHNYRLQFVKKKKKKILSRCLRLKPSSNFNLFQLLWTSIPEPILEKKDQNNVQAVKLGFVYLCKMFFHYYRAYF